MSIPFATRPSQTQSQLLIFLGEIGDQLTIRRRNNHLWRRLIRDLLNRGRSEKLSGNPVDQSAYGYVIYGICTCFAVHVLAHAVFAPGRLQQWLVIKIHEIVGMHICPKNDVAPPAAVPSIWAASRHKLFPSKTDTPVSAITGFCMDSDLVDEHGTGPEEVSGFESNVCESSSFCS